MDHAFDQKVARGDEHIDALREAVRDHFDKDKHTLVVKKDANRPDGVRFDLPMDAPARIALIAGDAVQNLRSALDYLACALVVGNNSKPTEATQFPLMLRNIDGKGNTIPVKIDGEVHPDALAVVEALQPYHAGHPSQAAMVRLGQLKELSNVDKHRHLPIVVTRLAEGSHIYEPPGGLPDEMTFVLIGHMDDGADFGPIEGVQMKGRISLQVAIGPSVPIGADPPAFPKGYEPLVSTLRAISGKVHRVIEELRPFV